MKFSLLLMLIVIFSGCNSFRLQGLIDKNADKDSSYDYNSSNMKKLDEMPAIGKSKCKTLTCRKK